LAGALNNLATGLNLTVRNVATHTRDELTTQQGVEGLAAYSYFARQFDQCEIRRAAKTRRHVSRSGRSPLPTKRSVVFPASAFRLSA
jgi:hypothetical protein